MENSGFKPVLAALCLLLPAAVCAGEPYALSAIQVTATQTAQPVEGVPLSITVIDGDELRARGVTDLAGALALVGGVNAARGGDSGPAAVVPGLLGQRESDDFLLVVDGVPVGGATTPTFEAVDLTDVERIEVQRGLAPIYFGTLAFAGTVQVIHYSAGQSSKRVEAFAGLYGTKGTDLALPLPTESGVRESISGTVDHLGYSDSRAGADRYQMLYRAAADLGGGTLGLDLNLLDLRQKPFSPTPVVAGMGLDSTVPIDSNENPSDARINQYRSQLILHYERKLGQGNWDSLASLTHTVSPVVQGFLDPDDCLGANACGYTQLKRISEVYLDSHFTEAFGHGLAVTLGANEVYGFGRADTVNFGYPVVIGQVAPPSGQAIAQNIGGSDDLAGSSDLRSLLGLYAQSQWRFAPDWTLLAGIRENLTQEDRATYDQQDGDAYQNQHKARGSGGIGLDWRAIHGPDFSANPYISYANTFQPSQFDFSPDPDNAQLLQPESALSLQFGVKGEAASGRIDWDLAAFEVHFNNRVITQQGSNGQPTLVNGGRDRYQGLEAELHYLLYERLRLSANYAYNDSRFRDFLVSNPDGTADEQLAGKRLPFTPDNLAALGLLYGGNTGFNATLLANYDGERFLDQENTIAAKAFVTLDAKLGYGFGPYAIALSGTNLSNRRDPVIASEVGDGHAYRLVARQVLLQLQAHL